MANGQLRQSLSRTKTKITPSDMLDAPFNKVVDNLTKNDMKMYGKVREATFNRIKKIREADALHKQDKKITDPIVLKMIKENLNSFDRQFIKGTKEYDERTLEMSRGAFGVRRRSSK